MVKTAHIVDFNNLILHKYHSSNNAVRNIYANIYKILDNCKNLSKDSVCNLKKKHT